MGMTIDGWVRDLRYALRVVRRQPGFAATVVLTLGLAVGSASAIYSLIDAVVIRPLPYPSSERLVALFEARRTGQTNRTGISPGRIEDWQQLSSTLESVAGSYRDTLNDNSGPAPERVTAAYVSPRFFRVLGRPAALGRAFSHAEESFGGPATVVLSDAYWRRRFGADPSAVGRTLELNGSRYAIVGVMPPSFRYPDPSVEIWLAKQARPELLNIRVARFYAGIGRLKPGVSLAQARADLDAIQHRLAEQYPNTDAGVGAAIEPLKDLIVGASAPALWLLAGAVSVLLLIGCANIACLLLSRLNARAAEIATRRSLGASGSALARQLLAEGLIYAVAGGLLGLAAAYGGAAVLRNRLPDLPRISELSVDGRMLMLVTATSILAALLFSLAPVLQTARRDLSAAWMRGGRGVAGGRQRLPRFLVAAQFALATALMIAAGLFVRTLANLENAPLGFRSDNVVTFHIGASYSEPPDATVQRHRRLLDVLAAAPGVVGVAMSTGLPAASPAGIREFRIEGEPAPEGTTRYSSWRNVTTAYFEILGIPLLSGRSCQMQPDPARPFEAMVNRSFAARYFAGREPIGRALVQGSIRLPIVAVVEDVREDGASREPQPLIYLCGYLRFWPDPDILVRTRSLSAVAAAVRSVEPSSPLYASRPLREAVSSALDQTRFRTLLVTLFSTMSLGLSAIGLYGVMAYAVSQRSREIGIRLALGARRGQIVGGVLRSGALLAAWGAAAGLASAAAAARLIGTMLYGVRPFDIVSYAGAVFGLFVVALLACVIPARRAVSIEPVDALRES